jgi:hypothetical protein
MSIGWAIVGGILGVIIGALVYNHKCKKAGEPDATWQDVKDAWTGKY